DNDSVAIVGLGGQESAADLLGQRCGCLARFIFLPCVAYANQRKEIMGECGPYLERNRFIALAEMRPPFTMADLYKRCADILNHHWRNFAGPRACISPMHILRANPHRSPCENRGDIGDRRERWNDEGARARRRNARRLERLGIGARLCSGFVYLPACSDPG